MSHMSQHETAQMGSDLMIIEGSHQFFMSLACIHRHLLCQGLFIANVVTSGQEMPSMTVNHDDLPRFYNVGPPSYKLVYNPI